MEKLYRLVASLTKSEKRYFVRFTEFYSSNREQDYFIIYKMIENYDAKTRHSLDTKLKKSGVKNLSSKKKYLYDLLLDNLVNMRSETVLELKILSAPGRIQVLREKGFYEEAYKMVIKNIKLTYKLEKTSLLIYFIAQKMALLNQILEKPIWEEEVKTIHKELAIVAESYVRNSKLYNVSMKLHKEGVDLLEEDKEFLSLYKESQGLEFKKMSDNNKIQKYIHGMERFSYLQISLIKELSKEKKDWTQVLLYTNRISSFAILESSANIINDLLIIFANLLSIHFACGERLDSDYLLDLENKIYNTISKKTILYHKNTFKIILFYKAILLEMQEVNKEYNPQFETEFLEEYSQYKDTSNSHHYCVMLNKIASYLIFHAQYKTVSNIIIEDKELFKEDRFILPLICVYETGHHKLLLGKIRSARYFQSKEKEKNIMLTEVINFFDRIQGKSKPNLLNSFIAIKSFFEEEDPITLKYNNRFIFVKWCQDKIENLSA